MKKIMIKNIGGLVFMKGKVYNEKTGKWISGGALQQHIIKENGVWEQHHRKVIEQTTEEIYAKIMNEMENVVRRKSIRRVK